MGKTYKDSRNFNPKDKPKVKGSQRGQRLKSKIYKEDNSQDKDE